jgi:hypothetical protein
MEEDVWYERENSKWSRHFTRYVSPLVRKEAVQLVWREGEEKCMQSRKV